MQLMGDESASIGTGLQTARLGSPDTFADWQRIQDKYYFSKF